MKMIRRSIGTGRGRHFTSLDEYLKTLVPEVTFPRWLTMVITQNNEPAFPSAEQRSKGRTDEPPVPAGFPWITPVLGSGSVEVRLLDDGLVLQQRLADIEVSESVYWPGDGWSAGRFAAMFARSMLVDRLGESWDLQLDADALRGRPSAATDRLANLLVVVGLLTRLHHRAMDELLVPTSRWDDPEPSVLHAGWRDAVEGGAFLLPLVEDLLVRLVLDYVPGDDEVPEDAPHPVVDAAVGTLLSQCSEELGAGKLITLSNLRLLTECAWYFLVEDCLTYPGWSDLMLDLAMQQDPIAHQYGWPRPLYRNIDEPEDEIRIQYQKVTRNSWTDRRDRGSARPASLHDRVAGCLMRQAQLRARNLGPCAVPMSSAFVTSFDLELELALMDARQPFVSALPVFVEATGSEELAICWIGCVMDPTSVRDEEVPDRLFEPGKWFKLSGFGGFGKTIEAYRDLPVVVRLTGCPAIKPPNLGDEPELLEELSDLVGIGPDNGEVILRPAFVMDEYVAGAMAATDTFLDHLELARLGLPHWIAGVPGGANAQFARFWLVLGVQLGDSSIRQRVVAQLTAPRLVAASPAKPPAMTGLVLNRRIGPLDGWLMRWQGFDIVSGKAATIAKHLAHYEAHLRDVEKTCDPTRRCRVVGGPQ